MTLTNPKIHQVLNSPWPARIVSAIITILIAWWVYANVLPLFAEKEIVTEPTANITKPQTPKKVSLSKLDLFGIAENSKSKTKPSETKITKLNLTLRGILATDDPKQGIAQIQNANKQEKEFVVNDSIFGQATLEEIYIDRVIILHNGKHETLLLPEEFLNTKHFENAKLKQERKKVLTDLRDLFLTSDIDALLKLLEFQPAYLNGGFAGFFIRVLGEKGTEMLATFGLLDGDLITVLNGLRFSESLEASEQLKELKYQTSIDIVIEREDQEIPFHFDVNEAVVKQYIQEEEAELEREKNSGKYRNTIDTDGKVDRSGFTQSLIDSRDDEDIEPDWDKDPESKAEAEAFIEKQRKRRIDTPTAVEFDH